MLLFIYGTLKRGGVNHHYMQGQRFLGEAASAPLYRLHDLGGYPGMVTAGPHQQGLSIRGEVWEVDAPALAQLDILEDLEGGEYTRETVPLLPPWDEAPVQGYRYLWPVSHARDAGDCW
ncbi:MAG TPA: gamma-glutamylcyclotransferase family protein [Prosthecobacter sp.]